MHNRCWVFLTQILDVGLIKQHLGLFVGTLCHQARRNKFEPDDLLMNYYPAHWDKANKFYHKTQEYKDIHKDEKYPFDGCCVPRDPLNIPELREILQDPGRIRETLATKAQMLVHVSIPNTPSAGIPPDIVLIIMDLLPG